MSAKRFASEMIAHQIVFHISVPTPKLLNDFWWMLFQEVKSQKMAKKWIDFSDFTMDWKKKWISASAMTSMTSEADTGASQRLPPWLCAGRIWSLEGLSSMKLCVASWLQWAAGWGWVSYLQISTHLDQLHCNHLLVSTGFFCSNVGEIRRSLPGLLLEETATDARPIYQRIAEAAEIREQSWTKSCGYQQGARG